MIDDWVSDDMAEEGRFVLDVLSLYEMIDDYLTAHPTDTEVGGHPWAKFHGFDGNNESQHYGFTRFIVDQQGRFPGLKKYGAQLGLNSHAGSRHICPTARCLDAPGITATVDQNQHRGDS